LRTDPFQKLLLPVETVNRELDAKLLVACVAAEAGFSVIMGSKRDIHLQIDRLPAAIYLGKSLSVSNFKLYRKLHALGYLVASGDEEALVYYSPETYRKAKLWPATIEAVDVLLAWGEENKGLWCDYSHYDGTPVYVTGNPRIDFLRPEMRAYWSADVQALNERYGNFILLNSNFGKVNHYRSDRSVQLHTLQEAATNVDSDDDFDVRLAAHRFALFKEFQKMVLEVAAAYPDRSLIIRPHPSESQDTWRDLTAGCSNVHVVHEGNVIPWLLGADAIIHNGCTTAIEGYIMGKPAISFQPVTSDQFDLKLPNDLSYKAPDTATVCHLVGEALTGGLKQSVARKAEQDGLLAQYIDALNGSLSSERTIELLSNVVAGGDFRPQRSIHDFVSNSATGALQRAKYRIKPWVVGAQHRLRYQYHDHIFPDIPVRDIEARIGRLQRILGRFKGVRVCRLGKKIFQLNAGSA
jgi:surface carbohydrate biosynthesis protein